MLKKRQQCKRKSLPRPAGDRGQAVVEFALVMVFFLMILLAVLDLGRAYLSVVALENAAAEGAMFGLANPTCETSGDCADPDNIVYRVKHESPVGLLNPDDPGYAVVVWPAEAQRLPGTQLVVTVTYPFHPVIPLLSAAGADPIWLSSTAKQLIP